MGQLNNNQENRFTFYSLIQKYDIVIPIIQRDYAQGRVNQKTDEVREDFLDSLYKYLEDGKSHDLDFVYGSVENHSFIPLDGQQRLTTLFLLHWYLMQQVRCINTKNADSSREELIKKILSVIQHKSDDLVTSAFLYETRQTSTRFCNKLVGLELNLKQLIEIKIIDPNGNEKSQPSISATLHDYNWFSPEWDMDPTIQSMLVMLDAIHDKFKDCDHQSFLERLLDDVAPAITFDFMSLDKYNLTDELYIKMNARGKPLTPFENFKAKFEQYIGTLEKIDGDEDKNELSDLDHPDQPDVQHYFSFNIDTKWTNLFWAYCQEELREIKKEDLEKYLENSLDKKMANFIRVIFTYQFAEDQKDNETLETVLLNKKVDYLSYNRYDKCGILSPQAVSYLIKALDVLSNGNHTINTLLKNNSYFDEDAVFRSVINHFFTELEYDKMVRLHAYLKYLVLFKGAYQADDLDEWMRFVYNLSDLENTRTDDPSRFAAAIKSISKILDEMNSQGQPSVLDFLASKGNDFRMGHFSSWQVTEEVIKAHLMRRPTINGINWTDEILKLEGHDYFNGQIGFILEFSDILNYFTLHNGFNGWDAVKEKRYFDDFVKNGKIASELFKGGYEKRVYAANSLLERAAMTFNWRYILGKHNSNSQYPENYRANLLNSISGEKNVRRDFSWRKMLHINTDDAFRHLPIKDLFNQIDADNVEQSVVDIIKNALSASSAKPINGLSWVDAFVRYPSNMKLCKNGFTYFWENRCILIGRKNCSKDDAELFTYTIWEKGICLMAVDPKFNLSYKFSNINQDVYPHIMCKFTFEEQEYAIRVMTVAENWEFKNYEFQFENINDQLMPIPAKLIGVLQPLGFSKASGSTEQWTLLSKAATYDDEATVQTELQNMMSQLLTVI